MVDLHTRLRLCLCLQRLALLCAHPPRPKGQCKSPFRAAGPRRPNVAGCWTAAAAKRPACLLPAPLHDDDDQARRALVSRCHGPSGAEAHPPPGRCCQIIKQTSNLHGLSTLASRPPAHRASCVRHRMRSRPAGPAHGMRRAVAARALSATLQVPVHQSRGALACGRSLALGAAPSPSLTRPSLALPARHHARHHARPPPTAASWPPPSARATLSSCPSHASRASLLKSYRLRRGSRLAPFRTLLPAALSGSGRELSVMSSARLSPHYSKLHRLPRAKKNTAACDSAEKVPRNAPLVAPSTPRTDALPPRRYQRRCT